MDDKVEEIRQLYLKFEGLTGLQDADALLLLALVVKEGMKGIEDRLSDIESALDSISANMPS